MTNIPGIHHITAIDHDAKRSVEFYTKVLGLRMVKLTVNYDDPSMYHLYFADKVGSPGTVLTFFPMTHASAGRPGNGLTQAVAFSIPPGAINFWMERFAERAIDFDAPVVRFGEEVLGFTDPDGMKLELVSHPSIEPFTPWEKSTIPTEFQIRGFYGASLQVAEYEPSAELLTKIFGFTKTEEEGNRYRFSAAGVAQGRVIDLVCTPDAKYGEMGGGSVHHIAFRVATDEDQMEVRSRLLEAGFNVTEQYDRNYFHSIYFREPGGIIFEIATDKPGFTTDEPLDQLGSSLKLPPFLELRRAEIEQRLPKLTLKE